MYVTVKMLVGKLKNGACCHRHVSPTV